MQTGLSLILVELPKDRFSRGGIAESPVLTKPCHKWCFFSIFSLIIIPTKKGVIFLYVCPYSNQSPAKQVVAFILTKAHPKGRFTLFLSLF